MNYDLGFLGGGQLARMSIQAAQRMGLKCVSLDSSDQTPASQIADFKVGSLKNASDVREIFDCSARVTLENEFIPAQIIEEAAKNRQTLDRLIPSIDALAIVQDKLHQRQALLNAKVPSPQAVALEGDGESALNDLGLPLVLKTRFGGYDGKGTRYARTLEEFFALKSEWAKGGWLAEEFVPFRRELAVMVAVGSSAIQSFPTVETIQKNSVCDIVLPSLCDASTIARAAVEAVGGTGLFGVELFEMPDGSFLVNELAPRPHNSGHYTLDWGGASQFEYHVRTVMGFDIDEPSSNSYSVMVNLLGQSGANNFLNGVRSALAQRDTFVHWYGKKEAVLGRKMGHLNVVGRDFSKIDEVVELAKSARTDFYRAWTS